MRTSKWVWFAFALTVAYVVLLWLLGTISVAGLRRLDLNNLGDFLAGVFAPLAFLWLATAVVLQSQELKAQREELSLTRAELEMTRKVLAEQAAEARNQAAFIGQQTNIMARKENDRVLDAKVRGAIGYAATNLRGDLLFENSNGNRQKVAPPLNSSTLASDLSLKMISSGCIGLRRTLEQQWIREPGRRLLGDAQAYADFLPRLREIKAMRPGVSEERRVYLDEMLFGDDVIEAVEYVAKNINGSP